MRRLVFVSVCAVVVFALVGAGSSSKSPTAQLQSFASPPYSADQLNASPGDNWLTNGGDLKNDRYSTLNQITPANVGTLKLAWSTDLGICPTHDASCGSQEGNAVVADGVMYIATAKSDTFALNAATGAIMWHYTPQFDPGFQIGTGGRQPGVAIGDGKVFLGQRDGYVVALDQNTGGMVWKAQAMDWHKGGRLSEAPLYYNGMVIEGTSGSDGGSISNTMEAFNATTGALLWSWSVVPQAGQPGANTWSFNGAKTGYNYGGGAMWETPAIDPKLNLLYFGTGNPVPWNSRGPGKNLWTDSIVALNVYTGALVWGFQTTHHDLWDNDLPNSPVLFTGKFKTTKTMKSHGKTVKKTVTVTRPALAEVAKVGWTFVLDRETGKPLIPAPETKVPQSKSADVNTWPTQPIPQTDNVIGDPKGPNGRLCAKPDAWTGKTAPDGKPYKVGCVFDPYDSTQFVVAPFEEMDWPASSYSPQTGTFITCGVTNRAFGKEQVPSSSQVLGPNGGIGAGILSVSDDATNNLGNFSALNPSTGKLAWHQQWQTPCYSGSVNTATGLTFIGHIGPGNGQTGQGYLEAVSTKTGQSLWSSPPMTAPATAPTVTYTANGKQYISVLSGGESHDDPTRPQGLTSNARVRGDTVYAYTLP